MQKLLRVDWDIVAGIVAAVAAIVLHLLHVAESAVLLTIILVLLALLLLRSLRSEHRIDGLTDAASRTEGLLREVQTSLRLPDAILIGPRQLHKESERFTKAARGEMIWFNVCCLMFTRDEVFDTLLKPAITNPLVAAIQFVSDESERPYWQNSVLPKIRRCSGYEKVRQPRWTSLPKTVSFILADVDTDGRPEALLSFWGEPFMAHSMGQQIPRYIFRVHAQSELLPHLIELERQIRMAG